jgi:hypothetical protein
MAAVDGLQPNVAVYMSQHQFELSGAVAVTQHDRVVTARYTTIRRENLQRTRSDSAGVHGFAIGQCVG